MKRFGMLKFEGPYSLFGFVLSAGCAALGTKSSPSLELSRERDHTKFTKDVTPCHAFTRKLAWSEW